MTNCGKCLPFIGKQIKGDRFGSKQPNQTDIETSLWRASYPWGCGRDGVHVLDMKQKNYDTYSTCPKFLDEIDSLLTHPKEHYRELEVDRFYDLHRDPASFIFWDYAVDTKLQAKDNYRTRYPTPIDQNVSMPPGERSYAYR
jgi:hypothetical protein